MTRCSHKANLYSIKTSTAETLRLPAYFREGITGDQLKVDCADIISYNAELAKYVLENPTESLPLVHLLSSLPGSSLHPRTLVCTALGPLAIHSEEEACRSLP